MRTVSKQLRMLVILEAVFCFALPAYFMFWDVLELPLWMMRASNGAGYAAVHALGTIGGCLGLWALFRTVRYYVSSKPLKAPNWPAVGLDDCADGMRHAHLVRGDTEIEAGSTRGG